MMKKLLNPLAYYNAKTLLFIGIITHLLFCYIAYVTHSFFPDFLSIKKSTIDFKFIDILYQNTRSIAIAILVLFAVGKFINSRTRIIDIVNVVLISRIAYYMVFVTDFIPIINKKIEHLTEGVASNNLSVLQDASTMTVIVIVAFIAIAFIALMFYYLYISFKTVTNLKTLPQVFAFIAAILFIIISTSILSLIIPQTI
ncbi:hypothetical protein SAMN05443634_103191 [Chishuiella changwenlii]|uniref:Yip1 domain-containing protein n=1 Tax=Chishuiella changwenlii TaxID=1434701 RepID=A0A1M6V517_9FLAO|nr:hypothetical protein [Chishuiella changwenlii]GGF01810.1 hypothetical protein GCM10010984_19090 [Chishuiella changwenlii]SHK76572.1 hypothetical protein SAMN05443634_103191 [Chishuiella changwenlii]